MTGVAQIPVVAGGVTYQITGANLTNYFTGSYGNTNVVANLAALGTNPVSTTGNITAGNIGITGGSLTWANASIVQTSASDVSITGDGQVTVRSLDGTYQWTFESNGNLTAPGNVSTTGNITGGNLDAVNLVINSISSDDSSFVTIEDGVNVNGVISATGNITGNYFVGNGSQLTGISAGANTGNVTFSGETVIGTGTSNLISGLYLAPSSSSANASMYLRVRGNINDEPTHIHFDTGNNAYYNQFIGDDNKYIQLANTGNIIINSNDGGGNSAQWIFAAAGETVFPTLTTQRGDNPSGTITGQTLLFGDPSQEAIISTADGTVSNENSQRLVINPGQGYDYGEGGDIYLWAGRGGDGSGSGGDIKIRGGQGGANTTGGSGGAGGYIRMEAGNSTDAGAPGFVEITGGWGADSGQGGNITITTGDSNAVSGNVLIYSGVLGWTIGNDGKITLPHGASLNDTSGDSVAFGQNAGLTSQAQHAVAIGINAGREYQGEDSIAIGYNAGYRDQGRGVAIGWNAGQGGTLFKSVSDAQGGSGPVHNYVSGNGNPTLTLDSVVSVNVNDKVFGNNIPAGAFVASINAPDINISAPPTAALTAGDDITFVSLTLGLDNASNVVVGMRATGTDIPANTFVQNTGCSIVEFNQYPTAPLTDGATIVFSVGQGFGATAVGYQSGSTFQGDDAVAVGRQAGYSSQNDKTVAVGGYAGYNVQGANAVAVGYNAGQGTQGINAVAVGYQAGQNTQGARAVAIGEDAGYNTQGEDAVAVGQKAGFSSQGRFSVAIGNTAGTSGQGEQAVAIGYGTGLVSQQLSAVAIGANAASYAQGAEAVAIGKLAGNTSQGSYAVAVGVNAGYNTQGNTAVAIGENAGYNTQGNAAVAIGNSAGAGGSFSTDYVSGAVSPSTTLVVVDTTNIVPDMIISGTGFSGNQTVVTVTNATTLEISASANSAPSGTLAFTGSQGIFAVAIGNGAGQVQQGNLSVAIGSTAGNSGQGSLSVAIGYQSGAVTQSASAVAVGAGAGAQYQGIYATAIGPSAGFINQGNLAVAVGLLSGANAQGANTVAIGTQAGAESQGIDAVAIGAYAGNVSQGNAAVAIGRNAGNTSQGLSSIAIGENAGYTNQANNSIILNATGANLNQTTANTFTVAPVRNDVANTGQVVFYNTTSKEITYGNVISVAGNITGGNLSAVNLVINNIRSDDSSFVNIEDGVNVTGAVVASANITGGYILGNGSQLTGVNAVTVDVTDTNGLTTIYYPTFVENRTTAQIARADVNLTYRTDDNLLTVGNVSVTGNIDGGNLRTAGQVSATGNITGGNILGGANVNATTHTGTTVSVTGNITGGNLAISGNSATITSANYQIGYLEIPQISFAANATAALVDSGKHYYSTSASNLALTLADNSAVSWPVGTAISVINRGTANITVAPAAGVSLYLAGNSTSGNRTVTTYGMATVMNVAANIWMISGTVV
jgi:hypothetical protein